MFYRGGQVALLLAHDPQVMVRFGITRLQPYGLGIALSGGVEPSLRRQDITEIVMKAWHRGVAGDGLCQELHSQRGITGLIGKDPEAV
jgi:hypothetical protein